MTPAFLTGLDMLKQMQSLTGCCDTQPPVVVYRDRPGQSQPAAAVPDDSLRHKAGAVAAFLESTLRTNSRDITDWCDDVEAAANTLRKALAAAPQAPQQAEPWRPIETAPRDPDGPNLLLSNGRSVHEGGWVLVSDPEDYTRKCYGWWDVSGGMLPEPTHWMPLPAPPATLVA